LFPKIYQYNVYSNMFSVFEVKDDLNDIKPCDVCDQGEICGVKWKYTMKNYGDNFRCDTCTECYEHAIDYVNKKGENDFYYVTKCGFCEICTQVDRYYGETVTYEPEITGGTQRSFPTCLDCSGCLECKPNNPPGLKGHTMLMGREGIIVYGGATWTVTDLDLTDEIAEEKEKYNDECLAYLG